MINAILYVLLNQSERKEKIMIDARGKLLAHNLINHSLKLKPGEKVLIETHGVDTPFMNELVKEAYAVGGLPFVNIKMPAIDRNIAAGCTEEQLKLMYKWEEDRMLAMDCYIGVRLPSNGFEESGVAFEKWSFITLFIPANCLWKYAAPLPAGWCCAIHPCNGAGRADEHRRI